MIADVTALDRSYYSNQTELTVATFRKPDAILFKGQQSSSVSAWVTFDLGGFEHA